MKLLFKNGDWVAHTAPVPPKRGGEPDVEKPYQGHRRHVATVPTPKVATYIGRIKKIVIEEEKITYYVVFGPEDNWVRLSGEQLERAAIQINPPTTGGPGDDFN